MKKQFTKIALAVSIVLAMAFTFSCSGGDDPADGGEGTGNTNEGFSTYTYGIKDVTDVSFTMVEKWNECQENGTLKELTEDNEVSYSVNGQTLSFLSVKDNYGSYPIGIDFKGNSNSLIGTWTRQPFSANCEDYEKECDWYNEISKAVFTQNSLILTHCVSEREEYEYNGIVVKRKVINCGTAEDTKTKGTDTVIVLMDFEKQTATFNNETCISWFSDSEHSKSKEGAACTEAFNRVKAEGNDGSAIKRYFAEILREEEDKCLKDKQFPEWFYFN